MNGRVEFGAILTSRPHESAVHRIRGMQLSQVWFVRDYIMLHFDDECSLTVGGPISVIRSGQTKAFGEPSFRDSLCECIDSSVTDVEWRESQFIRIAFDNGTELRLSIRSEDYVSPEIGVLRFKDGSLEIW
jgi:hypothetical protein